MVTSLNPSVCFVGCPCHIIHNAIAAQRVTEVLREMAGVDIEEYFVDHYHWCDKSTKRKGDLEQYSTFFDTAHRSFIKHLNVQWLSFQKTVERLLQMYAVSTSYFRSEGINEARFVRLLKFYENPMFGIYLLFIQAILYSCIQQPDVPQVCILNIHMQNLPIEIH